MREVEWDPRVHALVSRPVAEYQKLHNATYVDGETLTLTPGNITTLPVPSGGAGGAIDVMVSFDMASFAATTAPSHFGVAVRASPTDVDGAGQKVEFFLGQADADGARTLTVSGRRGSARPPKHPPPPPPKPFPAVNATKIFPGETLDVRVLVDRMIVEVFVMGGRLSWTHSDVKNVPGEYAFDVSNTSVHLFNRDAEHSVTVSNVSVYGMACGWRVDLPEAK